ncbi:hypothetical protein H0S73_15025 [Microvirga sp. Marseille-Q2068]|uniref:STAS domain-containing protein n=1 Tax=Microvirga mediterraneensis TaxID=2754695 RepID=A0A838BPS4_9HYPH|nr:hypothetical protein [Microvirga mediterraneensis]
MSARLNGEVILLEGQCRVEDAEPLLAWLQANRNRIVDLTNAEHLHGAVFQILMALKPAIRGEGKDAFLRDWLTPVLTAAKPPGQA